MWWNNPLLALSVLSLQGCLATLPADRLLPPVELLQDCVAVCPEIKTNAELARCALIRKQALEICNADKGALRKWSE